MPFSDGGASTPECSLPVDPGGAFPILSFITEQAVPMRRPHHILIGGAELPMFLGVEMTLIWVGELVLEWSEWRRANLLAPAAYSPSHMFTWRSGRGIVTAANSDISCKSKENNPLASESSHISRQIKYENCIIT